MKKLTITILLFVAPVTLFSQKKEQISNSLSQDKAAIKKMEGIYLVTFEFAETFSPDSAYQYHDRKFSNGIEYVFVIEETERKIILQHLLIVHDSVIVKHWRQDWIYENDILFNYHKDGQWKKTRLGTEAARGTWTQKVFNVDDSPRYESYGTWIHVDGRHFWESTCDAPLPRREFTQRNDYNVLRRHNHIEILGNGWMLEQDNQKIVRNNGKDKLICSEKGMEKFTKGSYNAQPAVNWWKKNYLYWQDVRKVWEAFFIKTDTLIIQKNTDGKILFEELFDAAEKYSGESYSRPEAMKCIETIIDKYIIK